MFDGYSLVEVFVKLLLSSLAFVHSSQVSLNESVPQSVRWVVFLSGCTAE